MATMGVVTGQRGRILRACETHLAGLALLTFSKGERKEAADAAAAADRAVTELLRARHGKIRPQEARGVWGPASDALAFRSWLWFTIAVVCGVGGLLITLVGPTAPLYARLVISFLPALPSAMFASRQIGHVLADRALRAGRADRSTLLWINRWLGEGAVLALTAAMWAVWTAILVL
jgi:hypothetical protein